MPRSYPLGQVTFADGVNLGFPAGPCCNCGARSVLAVIEQDTRQPRLLGLGAERAYRLPLPFCTACVVTARRRPATLPQRLLVAAIAFEVKNGVHHVLHNARSGNLALLGHMAHQNHGGTGLLGKPDHGLNTRAHLRHRTGCRIDNIAPQCLNGINDDEVWPLAFGKRGEDIFDIGFGSQKHIGGRRSKPLCPKPHLRHGLFTGDIDDSVPASGEGRSRLHEQGGFADAGIAAHQHRRSPHETATSHAIQLADARLNARRFFGLPGKRRQRNGTALLGCLARTPADAAQRIILDDRVPFAASIALPGPARVHRAAVLADELGFCLGHDYPVLEGLGIHGLF